MAYISRQGSWSRGKKEVEAKGTEEERRKGEGKKADDWKRQGESVTVI